jgi:hypothetical protein
MIYGDTTDNNLLEAAVRWVIILIVIVFDPLAIALVLAANASKEWDKEKPEEEDKPDPWVADVGEKPTAEELEPEIEKVDDTPIVEEPIKVPEETKDAEVDKYAYLKKPFVHFQNLKPMPAPMPEIVETPEVKQIIKEEETLPVTETIEDNSKKEPVQDTIIITEGVTKESLLKDLQDGYVLYDGLHYSKQALRQLKPELFIARPDQESQVNTNFGIKFPDVASKGDIFVRVDVLPNKVYKFSDKRWIEINKNNTNSYLYDQEYIKYLVSKISTGEYDLDLLTENERAQIEEYLNNQKS